MSRNPESVLLLVRANDPLRQELLDSNKQIHPLCRGKETSLKTLSREEAECKAPVCRPWKWHAEPRLLRFFGTRRPTDTPYFEKWEHPITVRKPWNQSWLAYRTMSFYKNTFFRLGIRRRLRGRKETLSNCRCGRSTGRGASLFLLGEEHTLNH